MSNNGLYANTEEMDAEGKQTVINADYFQKEIVSLKKNVDDLLAIWSGPSATEFQNSYTYQEENLQEFQKLLNELGENVSEAAGILETTEEDLANKATNLLN